MDEWRNPKDWEQGIDNDAYLICEHVFVNVPHRTSILLERSHCNVGLDGWSWIPNKTQAQPRGGTPHPMWLCDEHFQILVNKKPKEYPEIMALRELQAEVFKHGL